MQVFIMRHGDAALDAASDSVRPLTVCGCDESRQMATWLKGQKVDIERVLVSPFLRAEQTLEIVGECMNLPKDVDVMPELTPCGDVGMVSAYLQALANEGVATALVVSHLPLVGYLVSELCPGDKLAELRHRLIVARGKTFPGHAQRGELEGGHGGIVNIIGLTRRL